MKLMVLSDTHGYINDIVEEIGKLKPDLIVHLGDHFSDGEDLESITGIETIFVRGNCDFYSTRRAEDERIFRLENLTIYMTHGHLFSSKYTSEKVFDRGRELGADIILFGHSHYQEAYLRDGSLVMNPGSPTYPRGGSEAGYGIIHICNGDFHWELKNF